jgi:hypothetical protein
MRATIAAACTLAVASLAIARTAHADDDASAARKSVETYARGERGESLGLLGAGAVSLATAGAAYAQGDRLYQGAAIPLAAGGVLELVSGATLYVRTARWEGTAGESLGGDAPAFRAREIARLDGARRRLGAAQVAETVVFAGGGLLAFFTSGHANELARGIGIGCAVEGATLLTFDAFAALRGERYTAALRDVGLKVSPEKAGAVVAVQKTF